MSYFDIICKLYFRLLKQNLKVSDLAVEDVYYTLTLNAHKALWQNSNFLSVQEYISKVITINGT